jgi:hypothetical protein
MSAFQYPRVRTFKAAASLTGKKYHGVKLTANPNEVAIAVAGDAEFILLNEPSAAGEAAECAMVGGGAMAHAGAAVTIGQEVASNAAGKLIPAVAGNKVVGIALSAASTDEYFEIERVRYVKA